MFKSPSKNLRIYILCGLLITLVVQPMAFAQASKLVWWTIIWEPLQENLIGDSGLKSIGVYLPPGYEASNKRYPVIYVLHGFGGVPGDMARKVQPEMDRMVQNSQIQEMIAVFVNGSNKFGGSQYLSSPTIGDYETYVVRDLVTFIDDKYRTIPHPNSRGITGFSMGAYGSMHLALKYPDVFSVTVPQAGTYDFSKDWIQVAAEWGAFLLAVAEPFVSEETIWEEFAELPLAGRNAIAYLAAVASNPDRPPFYLDLPVELVLILPPKWNRVEEVWDRIVENDVIHELDRYLARPGRLNAVKLVHGEADKTALPGQAESLDQAMTAHGLIHEYEVHSGGHTFIAEKALQFLSDHLATATPDSWDVNNDGLVNILDLVSVASRFGERIITPPLENPDVNGDGTVNIFDLVLVGSHFGENIRSLMAPANPVMSTPAKIKFEHPRRLGDRMFLDVVLDTTIPLLGYQLQIQTDGLLKVETDAAEPGVFRLGAPSPSGTLIAAKLEAKQPWIGRVHLATLVLEAIPNTVVALEQARLVSADGRLIAVNVEPFFVDNLLPKETGLLPNYPNPFNPETWLPFQLRKGANVRITIYDTLGREIRQFDLGHQPASYYQTRERAVYWDGRNHVGERVASGTYFYRLEADDFVSVRRMVVLK